MAQRSLELTNRLGLHARAAAKLVHVTSRFAAQVTVRHNDEEVNGKSILGLLTLAATEGTPLIVRADGSDEEAAVKALVELFENKFGEGE
jgi:phosphotransferase system HPr (HPr) family protein